MQSSILAAAKRHLQALLAENKKDEATMRLYAGDNLAYEIAISALDRCIKANAAEAAAKKAEAEFDYALERMFTSRHAR
jgi:hypothetical protein